MTQKQIPDFIVVGSSFSGVASSRVLVNRGFTVLMLDGGRDLDLTRRQKIADAQHNLKKGGVFNYAESYRDISEGRASVIATNAAQLDNKAQFGSQYCYEGSSEFCMVSNHDDMAHLFGSLAVAGLSNVWGHASLPYSENDILDWPISRRDLEEGYRECLKWMPVFSMGPAGNIDEVIGGQGLALPFHNSYFDESGRKIQQRLLGKSGALRSAQIFLSASRLALSTEGDHLVAPCSKCGMCLDGCLHMCLFSTRSALEELKTCEKFSYLSAFVVKEYTEDAMGVDVVSANGSKLRARALVLGAGPLHSTQIVGQSLGWSGREVVLKDSKYWLTPFLSHSRLTNRASAQGVTLSHTFLEIANCQSSSHLAHVQIYGPNKPLFKKIEESLPFLPRALRRRAAMALFQRAGILQGFLHSADSPSLKLNFVRKHGDLGMKVAGVANQAHSKRVLALVRSSLSRNLRKCGIWNLDFLTQNSLPGRSFHSGSTLAMSKAPSWNQTDTLGRPRGSQRVHCVDSSVLPSIAASTITFTVAANASRIASNVPAP